MSEILAFPIEQGEPAPRVNHHLPPGWQRSQTAAIVALAAAEDQIASIGIPRGMARTISRAAVRTFLQNMAMSGAPLSSCARTHEIVEEFLNICELATARAQQHGDQAS